MVIRSFYLIVTVKKFAFAFLIFSLLFSAPVISAHNDDSKSGKSKLEFELKIDDDEDEDEDKFELGNQEFEITGEITSLGGNSFEILGQTINVDPSKVSKFEQKGILEVGLIAKVEGVLIAGEKFAQEIKVIGTGQGRFKFEIEGSGIGNQTNNTASSNPPSSPSPTIQSSQTSPTPSNPLPSTNSTPAIEVKIKAKGPIDRIVDFLKQILSFFQVSSSEEPEPSPSPNATPQPNITPLPSPSPSPSPTPSPSPVISSLLTATPSAAIQVKVEAKGPLDQVMGFLENILTFLQGLIT